MNPLVPVELDWPRHNAVRVGDELYFCLEWGGDVFLARSRCPHRGGPLHLGELDGDRLRCPWHGSAPRVAGLCNRALPSVRRGSRIIAYLRADRTDPARRPVACTRLAIPQRGRA